MSLIERAGDIERLFKSRSFVIESPGLIAKKQPDGRVQLNVKPKSIAQAAAPPPPPLAQLFFVAVENLNAIYGYTAAGAPAVPFASLTEPIGVAASSTRVLATQYETQNVNAIDNLGNVTVLASIPGSGPKERYIAIAPSQSSAAGFTPGDIFVSQGTEIYKIKSDGSSVTLFATISDADVDHTGLTFDKVGTFGNKLIATSINGKIWKVDSGGGSTLLVDTGKYIEGPAVAPSDFGTYAGQLLVADENNGQVHAIDNAGSVTLDVFDWSGAEAVVVILSSFAGLTGILVDSEFGSGIANISWNGSSYDINFFDSIFDALMEGACFVDPDIP
jgi:hypothetical protein